MITSMTVLIGYVWLITFPTNYTPGRPMLFYNEMEVCAGIRGTRATIYRIPIYADEYQVGGPRFPGPPEKIALDCTTPKTTLLEKAGEGGR